MADFEPQEEVGQHDGATDDAVVADAPAQTEQVDPIEAFAREQGWAPKEEWRGNPDDWRDPRDFLKYGMQRGKEAGREMRELRSTVDRIGKTSEALMRRQLDEQRQALESQFADAVENKDHEGARAAREELTRLEATSAQPSHDGDVQDFMSRNAGWFGQNRAATALARQITAEAAAKGVSPAEQLRMAEDAVKADFPQLFGQQTARAPAKAPAVNAPATRAAATAQRAKGFNDLPADAQRAGHDFVKRGMVKTLDDYAKVYLEENA